MKSVNEATVCNGQRHVPFFRFNFTHAHIAASSRLRQVDAALGAGVDLCAVAIRGIDQIRACNVDSLTCRTNAAFLAGQVDAPAFYGSTAARLGDIACCIQGHIPQSRVILESNVSVLALKRHDCHVPAKGLILQYAADSGDVDIPIAGRNGAEFDVVRHRSDFAVSVFNRRAHRSEMDILNIVFRRQVHDFALQGSVIKLGNAPRFGADIQRSLIMRVRHIARQVDTAACSILAFDVDAALFCANQPDGDGLGCVQGVVEELNGFCSGFPTISGMFEPAQETATPFFVRSL